MRHAIGTNETWTRSMEYFLFVQLGNANKSGNLMIHHPSFSKRKSHLYSSVSDEYHKKHSVVVIN